MSIPTCHALGRLATASCRAGTGINITIIYNIEQKYYEKPRNLETLGQSD